MLVYEALLSFLKDACSTNLVGPTEDANLRKILDGYLVSMTCDNAVTAIVESLKWRKTLLKISSQLGLSNDTKLRIALRTDDERIASLLVAIFDSKSAEEAVLRLEDDSAQYFLDVVQNTLDKGFLLAEEDSRRARRIIRKLSESCDLLPSSLFFTGVSGREEHPTFGGGFGDIFRASQDGTPVALKRMRHFLRGSDLRRIRLKFCREALVWKDLHHPHILPFLGIDRDSFPPPSLCMVSPWMEHGTVMNYLENHGHENVDRLLYEIAQGLEYLHSRNIVHGDLRGVNILIKEDWSACLTDFGLSKFSDATSAMTSNRGGSLYWMAPELLDPDRFGYQFARTEATDVYAFGCVCFELYTGRPPFANLTEPAALMKILNRERPTRPTGPPTISDTLWRYVSTYWADSPTARPTTQVVVQNMIWPNSLHLPPLLPNRRSPSPSSSSPSFSPIPLSQPAPSSSPTPAEPSSVLPPIDPTFSPQSFTDDAIPGADSDRVMDKILYDYTTPTDDPYETPMSFSRGETVYVLSQEGAWCEVGKNDGSIGIVPSDCLHNTRGSLLTEGSLPENRDNEHKKTRPIIGILQSPLTTPIHQQFATRPQASSDDDRWEVVEQHTPLLPGASPPVPSPTGARSPSPYTVVPQTKQLPPQQQGQTLRKKTPPVLGILRSLDSVQPHPGHTRNKSEERTQSQSMPPPQRPENPMKKLFYREIPKPLQPSVQQTPLTTPIHQYFAPRLPSSADDRWEIVEQHTPPLPPPGHTHNKFEERTQLESMPSPPLLQKEKEKKGGWFWGRRDKDKDRDRERAEMEAREGEREAREREHRRHGGEQRGDDENELTRMIGYLTATAVEDWTLVLDVCDRASATEPNAKAAVRALLREFKYGEPAAQLAAARLWAIMLRNSSDTFISQSTSRKFLDTLEDLLTSSRTSPVVRERVMDVLAAAAYASGSKKDIGFRGLWRRVKPSDKPEEGIPFDTEDAMFNPPPRSGRRPSATYDYDINGIIANTASPIVPDTFPVSYPPPHKPSDNNNPGSDENLERPWREREQDREFDRQVDKLLDLLPHAERDVLAGYLRRAGQDILALGQYLEDEKNGVLRRD